MALNQLIAQGGRNIKSPVQRYMETRAQMNKEQQNRLAQESTRQGMAAQRQRMGVQQQQFAMQQQKQKAEMGTAYAKSITPIISGINQLPETERQSAWSQSMPRIEQVAQQYDIPLAPQMGQWNQQRADALIAQHGIPLAAPETRTVLEGNEKVNQEWNERTGKWTEVGRGVSTQITAAPGELTKPAVTSLQKQLAKNLLSKDKITTGINFIMKNQNLFDLGSRMSAGVGNAMEYIGIDAPEYLRKEVEGMADLKTYTLNIANGIRKETTGAASSYKELDKFIYPLVAVATDGKTRAIKRMQALTQFNELTTVRLNQLLNDGYKVISRQGDKTMRVKSPDGKVIAVDKSFPLSSIPSYSQRKGQLLSTMAQGKKPSDFSEQQRVDMFNEVQNAMTQEGYNTDVSRAGWGQ